MPHLVLEYSSNVIEKDNLSRLLLECHNILAQSLPAKIESCKSRAIECTTYCVGDGNPANAFVHVSLAIMAGRTLETLKATADKLMEIYRNYFDRSLQQLNLQITIEISELAKTYVTS